VRRTGAVEDHPRLAVVAVDLGPLAELARVLQGQRGDAQQPPELVEVGGGGVQQVEPEELVALVQRADRLRIDAIEDLHRHRDGSRGAGRLRR
jgi:Tfp pilus assembly protein FimV